MVAAIGRTLIPRYFRSIFDGGVTELSYNLRHPKESFHNTSITLDCEQCTMITVHGKPMFTQVIPQMDLLLRVPLAIFATSAINLVKCVPEDLLWEHS